MIFGSESSPKTQNVFIRYMPPAVVGLCLFFNFFLCFINTNVATISSVEIILCEMILVGMAAVAGFYRIDRLKLFWLVVLFAQILLIFALSALNGDLLAKPLRDIIIVPVFIALGLAAYRIDFTRILLCFGGLVVVAALCEAFLTHSYLSVFNIREFYVAKGILEEGKPITDIDVFASGVRPGGRFLLDIPGVHRVSSVFLEPVSLGFYAFISGAYIIAVKDSVSKSAYVAGLAMSMILIWLSDARMALGALLLTWALRPLLVRLDHRLSVLILPLLFLIAYILEIGEFLGTTGEGVGARIHSTLGVLDDTTLEIFMGVSKYESPFVADSGLGYLINDQGFLGLLLFWLPPIFFLRDMPKEGRIYMFGIGFYLALGMLLSQAIFTIKTAALLWFCYGYIVSRCLKDEYGNYRYVS